MIRPGQIDHIVAGLADLPEKLRQPRVSLYYSIYLRQLNEIEELLFEIIDAFRNWQTTERQYEFVLNTIGEILDQPRPQDFVDRDYVFLLGARVLSRKSDARRDDVWRVAEYLARGRAVKCFFYAPKIVRVEFYDLNLTPQWQSLYRAVLLDAIDQVDKLRIVYASSTHAGYGVGLYGKEQYG